MKTHSHSNQQLHHLLSPNDCLLQMRQKERISDRYSSKEGVGEREIGENENDDDVFWGVHRRGIEGALKTGGGDTRGEICQGQV